MSTLNERALLTKLTRHMFNANVRDKSAEKVVDTTFAVKNAGKSYKQLFKGNKEFVAIGAKLSDIYNYHNLYSLPWRDGGDRILPNVYCDEYIDRIGKKKGELSELISKFCEDYDNHVQNDMNRLKDRADRNDYPLDADSFSSYFGADITLFPIPSSSDFRMEIDAETKAKLDKFVADSAIHAKRDICERVENLVNNIVMQMSKEDTRIHETLLSNPLDLAEIMQGLNVHQDPDIDSLAVDLKALCSSVSTFQLRNSEMARKELAMKAEKFVLKMRGETNESVDSNQAVDSSSKRLDSDVQNSHDPLGDRNYSEMVNHSQSIDEII